MLDEVESKELETVLLTTETIQEQVEDIDDIEEARTWIQMFKGTIESALEDREE